MARISGVEIFPDGVRLEHWWEWAFVIIMAVSTFFGCVYVAWRASVGLRKRLQTTLKASTVPPKVVRRLDNLTNISPRLRSSAKPVSKSTSFGVYLGSFDEFVTNSQTDVLTQWGTIILDPLQRGVLNTLVTQPESMSQNLIGRVDLDKILGSNSMDTEDLMVKGVDEIVDVVQGKFKLHGSNSKFTGILLAGWENRISAAVLNEVIRFLTTLGLGVYLEITPPNFLENIESPNFRLLAGVVVRNATILPNGERRDFFQMDKMKSTVKEFITQSCLRQFTVMMWETVEDGVIVSNPVAKRSFSWSSYYGALTWIGSRSALYDPVSARASQEPLPAFQWLKEAEVMSIHDKFRTTSHLSRRTCIHLQNVFTSIEDIFPSLESYAKALSECENGGSFSSGVTTLTGNSPDIDYSEWSLSAREDFFSDRRNSLEWMTHIGRPHAHPLSISITGTSYDALGCFPIGLHASADDFNSVVQSLNRLRRLNLLIAVPAAKVRDIGSQLKDFLQSDLSLIWPQSTASMSRMIQDNAIQMQKATESDSEDFVDPVQIYLCLDSGLHTSGDTQFWSVYETDQRTGSLVIYVSKSVQDLAGTILHTLLSSQSCQRDLCFSAEAALTRFRDDTYSLNSLPPRVLQDIELLTPADMLILLQHVMLCQLGEEDLFVSAISAAFRRKLIDDPSFKQMKNLGNVDYICGKVPDSDLVEARIAWYWQQRCAHLDVENSLRVFRDVERGFISILRNSRYEELDRVTNALAKLFAQGTADPFVDFFAFSIFCAARKSSFEEIYIEVTDRNPLFNEYSDQSAAFAELFALGSRCESYFDITPSTFGKLLSEKHRKYYGSAQNQPPMWIDNAPAFATSYAAAQTDIDLKQKPSTMPAYRRLTFLSVFAIPALVDILLLTTTERGLYLSGYMSQTEKSHATLALMISLLLSGAIGTWISIGGTYYLISMAFSAANMFVLTRLIGGLTLTVLIGAIGFVIITAIESFHAGIIFFLYLVALTSYLSVLATLSSFQFPGSSFLNGRYVIIVLLPMLAISPILTIWINGHDSLIYLLMLYIFIALMFVGIRWVAGRWVTWANDITLVDDAGVKQWYLRIQADGRESVFAGMTEPAVVNVCRAQLYEEVTRERKKKVWQKNSDDELVRKLAKCWDATIFLLDWYCRTTEVLRPIPYSSTWNIETRVAHDSLLQAQKGIRLHNSFIHWRNSGDEVGCGILYFIVALLDRWIELITGGPLIGLSAGENRSLRIAVGFGLAYYLISAVLLDYQAQHLHTGTQASNPVSIKSKEQIRKAIMHDAHFKQRLYWKTLLRFVAIHAWVIALTIAFIWLLNTSRDALITYLAYIGAYSGLLLYQYNKIFSGPHALMPLLAACLVGLPLGIALKHIFPSFQYVQVIALATGTWTAAVLSFRTAKLSAPRKRRSVMPSDKCKYRAYGGHDVDHEWSQSELEAIYDGICSEPSEMRFQIQARGQPGTEIKSLLLSCGDHSLSRIALNAFPNATELAQRIVAAWEFGTVTIEYAAVRSIVNPEAEVRAMYCFNGEKLHILIASDAKSQLTNMSSNCRIIAETMLRACTETIFKVPARHAAIAESLLSCRFSEEEGNAVSETFKTSISLDVSDAETMAHAVASRKALLDNLCLGIDCDTRWDDLPKEIREKLLKRCLGEYTTFGGSERQWLEHNVIAELGCDLDTKIARYDLEALLNVHKYNFFKIQWPLQSRDKVYRQNMPNIKSIENSHLNPVKKNLLRRLVTRVKSPLTLAYHFLGIWIKFFIVAWMADPEYQRELACTLVNSPSFIRPAATIFFNGMWIIAKRAQSFALPVFIYKDRDDVKKLWQDCKGTVISLRRNKLLVQGSQQNVTGYVCKEPATGTFRLRIYGGHIQGPEPEGERGVQSICKYSREMRLQSREEYTNGEVSARYMYDYHSKKQARNSKVSKFEQKGIPLSRRCVAGKDQGSMVQYNHKGHIESGSYMLHGNIIRFKFHYRKNAKYGDELLRAEFVLPHISCNVNWSAPPVRHPEKMERWIPHSRVIEATFVQGSDVYESNWIYDHKFHPTIVTDLNGHRVDTPPMIRHDWLGVLKKPTSCTFLSENPLLLFKSFESGLVSHAIGWAAKRRLPISTSQARTLLWKQWKKNAKIDAIIVRWLDEQLLRQDKILRPYWSRRDRGALAKAEDYLALHADAIMASADLHNEISAWTPLAIKMNDLVSFGQGGDAVVYTRTKSLQPDTHDSLHVIAVDTGTWPNEGGGVSACRRDMVNNLRTIRWHMICESANDFGLPKHQIEENVQSLKIVPLWGLDFLHPVHGMFYNKLDSEVDRLPKDTSHHDIRRNFLPILTALVKGARSTDLTHADVKQATRALVNLNTYFEDSRHWSAVWTSETVKSAWCELWLTDEMPNAKPPSEWFETELPTLGHLNTALELWFRYLFIFSIPIPEQVPSIFQASHHSVSAAYGVVCKIKRQCTLQIWDHAISWRETNLYLSSALCTLPPFIRNSLLGLMRLTSFMVLHHADQVLPCADFFNPGWEVEIGSNQGAIEHRNKFKRKIDPIVNGIADMQKFAPITEIKTEKPTVTMLSHVWYAKDIKTALLAADIVINEWGFTEYTLDIYGALNKAPIYSSECQEVIASKGLAGGVNLRGTADPGLVLANTWLFLNSSISEGLPLALGEAALTGAPVVCTDVGASLRVLTDPDNNERYSAVVAPNDPYALARAEISLLAMIGEWAKYAEDEPGFQAPVLPHNPTKADVEVITKRMYEKTPQRRKLGMMARSIVQKSFSGERYLREHEQMLWIGKSRREMLGAVAPPPQRPRRKNRLHRKAENRNDLIEQEKGIIVQDDVYDPQLARMEHPRRPWVQGHSRSRASSFSSVESDGEPDNEVGLTGLVVTAPPQAGRFRSSRATSFTSVDVDAVLDRRGRYTSVPGGVSGGRSGVANINSSGRTSPASDETFPLAGNRSWHFPSNRSIQTQHSHLQRDVPHIGSQQTPEWMRHTTSAQIAAANSLVNNKSLANHSKEPQQQQQPPSLSPQISLPPMPRRYSATSTSRQSEVFASGPVIGSGPSLGSSMSSGTGTGAGSASGSGSGRISPGPGSALASGRSSPGPQYIRSNLREVQTAREV